MATPHAAGGDTVSADRPGHQRLGIERLQRWENLGYGMFIHFGMSTYVDLTGKVCAKPDGNDPATAYAPDRLDVDQWVSVARDAGMKYAVLTAKHIAGFCLWPSKYTDYTVAQSGNSANVVEQFVEACRRRGVQPGLYYSAYDNHHRWGSRTRSDFASRKAYEQLAEERPRFGGHDCGREDDAHRMPYTTTGFQNFMTAQMVELLTEFGDVMEVWIDHPEVLGRGYRTFLYDQIARLQPDSVIQMNNGLPDAEQYDVEYAWPADLMSIERGAPPAKGYPKWRTIEGKEYYLPGEVCDSIAPIHLDWFYIDGDGTRPVADLVQQFKACRDGGANYLLNIPPDTHGLIPDEYIETAQQLRKEMGL